MKEGRVLVVQLARLGDLVQTWPLIRRLRHRNPGRHLDLLADGSLKALQAMGPAVDALLGVDMEHLPRLAQRDIPEAYDRVRHLADRCRVETYEAVYNLNFSRISLLLSYLTGGEVRGYQPVKGGREYLRDPWLALVFGLVHNRRVNRVHLSDVFRHLAPGPGLEPAPPAPVPRTGEPVIALQVATRHPERTWPLEAFTRLAGLLVDRLGAWIWLLGTKAEAFLGEAFTQGLTPAQRQRVVNLQGRTDLSELAARLSETHLLVSGDTGTLHLAAALGTRTVGIFLGPASCFETGPYGEGHYVFQAEPPCHPCVEAGAACPEPVCRDMIPPGAVADLVMALYRNGEGRASLSLPDGARLYRSQMDAFGVDYVPMEGGLNFSALVGLAYRRAGAQLLGLPWWEPRPGYLTFTDDDRRGLEGLIAALKNGCQPGSGPMATAAMLKPLLVFREEMGRQQLLGRDGGEAEDCLAKVVQGFRAGLVEMGIAG